MPPEQRDDTLGVATAYWWRKVNGATWRQINGLDSDSGWHPDHPVVQISHHDALAFARWAGGRLPLEAEIAANRYPVPICKAT